MIGSVSNYVSKHEKTGQLIHTQDVIQRTRSVVYIFSYKVVNYCNQKHLNTAYAIQNFSLSLSFVQVTKFNKLTVVPQFPVIEA